MTQRRQERNRQGADSPLRSRFVEKITARVARWMAPDRADGAGTLADSHEFRSVGIEAREKLFDRVSAGLVAFSDFNRLFPD